MTDEADIRRLRLIRVLALAGVLIVLLVLSSSALLRLRALGLGCADWPACYGQVQSEAAGPSLARVLHRFSASLAGASVIAIGVLALSRPRRFVRELTIIALMLVLLVALAYLGRATPGAQVPAVALGNVLGGMLLAALLGHLALPACRQAPAPLWLRAAVWSALLLAFAQIALGVLTSASHSGLACPLLPRCNADAFFPGWTWTDFDPWRAPAASAGVHAAHRIGGLLLLLLGALAAWGLRRRAPPLALALGLLLAAQSALGIVLVIQQLPLAAAVAHNFGAALLLLALVAAQRLSAGRGRL